MSIAEEFHPSPPEGGKPLPFGINRALLPIKAYYFVFMAAVGDLLPFISLYMRQLGLNATETGIIYGVMPFVGFFMRPVIGAVADKFHRHKLVLIIVTIVTGSMYMLLVTVPQRAPQPITTVTNLECNTQDSFLEDCANTASGKCQTGLSHLANMSTDALNNTTNPTKCSLLCKVEEEFRACYTNVTGSFDGQTCDGHVKTGKQLEFTVDDIQAVLDAEVTEHAPDDCKVFDLKHVYYEGEAWQILCDREVNLKCVVDCGFTNPCEGSVSLYDKSFFLFFFLFLMANIAFAPIFPILDAATYDILGEQRHKWGKQRLWGTFGFATFAVTSTFVMYYWRTANEDVNYTYSFYIFGILCFLSSFLAYFIQFSNEIKCGEFVKNVWKLLSFKEVPVFLFVIMYFGIVLGGLEAFLFWYLTGLGSHTLVFGFMLVVNCVAEIPMLWIAGAIIQKIGHIPCLYLALFCCGLRLLCYSLLEEPWIVLLVEPVHGVTFALMYAAASSYASIIAPPGMSATVQGLLGGVHFGFGKGIGSLITGFLFEGIGPRWTWGFFSILSIVILIGYYLLNTFVFKSQQASPVAKQNDQTGPEGDNLDQQFLPSSQSDNTVVSSGNVQGGTSDDDKDLTKV